MPNSIELRKLGDNYREILEDIFIESEFIDPVEEIIERIEDKAHEPKSQPFAVYTNSEIVSFFTIESSNPNIEFQQKNVGALWLESFFITGKFLGKGLAKDVVAEMIRSISGFYPEITSLNLTVNFRNEIAQNLYKKCGFKDTEMIYSGGPAGSQYIYTKELLVTDHEFLSPDMPACGSNAI